MTKPTRAALHTFVLGVFLAATLAAGHTSLQSAEGKLGIYGDALAEGWENWSWDTTVAFRNTVPVRSGASSIAITFGRAYAGFSLHVPGGTGATLPTGIYSGIRFWAYGGAGGTQLRLSIQTSSGGASGPAVAFTAPAGRWQRFDIAFSALGNPAAIARVNIQEAAGTVPPSFFVDDIELTLASSDGTPTLEPAVDVTVDVDAAAIGRMISPHIYGLHYTSEALADELDLPVRRWGGNDTTRYNWQHDLSNNGYDWYFENNKTRDLSVDEFVQRDRRTGTDTIVTIPMIGWVAKNDAAACGYSTTRYNYVPLPYPYGRLPATDQFRNHCGSGIVAYDNNDQSRPRFLSGNDPTDTSVAVDPPFVKNWVEHLVATHGAAADGGVRFYNLDNEPDLWNSTHRDVFPEALTYDELRDRTIAYAAAIKQADPGAQLLGPVSFGWSGFFYSAYDLEQGAKNGYTRFPDREAHGGTPLVAWYLQQMRDYEQQHGVRLVDYLDLHFYPQNGVDLRDAGDAAMQALRLRSTRALWDPSYRDESWIGGDDQSEEMRYVRLIPRMREWVDHNYPGTKLAITEYNWGGLEHINGALAQADVLGIFGREGVDLATLFDSPYGSGTFTPDSPGAFAFRMYRNYDGKGARFGDRSVMASSSDPARLAIYAARHGTSGALTLMVINKTDRVLTSNVNLAGFVPHGTADVYRYSAANLTAIEHLPPQSFRQSGFVAQLAPSSVTLFRIAPADPSQSSVRLPLLRR